MPLISIVDYGAVNLGSIRNMLRKLRIDSEVVSTPEGVERATKILLPGVGAFNEGMATLASMGLVEPLRKRASVDGVPMLGICLGMQMLGSGSEEGNAEGLGVIPGRCVRFRLPKESGLKVPHMGWNEPKILRPSPLVDGLGERARFYFTHSYHFVCDEPQDILATVSHGIDVAAIVERNNVMGTQFHPEKSHRFGMTILSNFGEL